MTETIPYQRFKLAGICSLFALVFFLPISIALVEVFAGITIFCYLCARWAAVLNPSRSLLSNASVFFGFFSSGSKEQKSFNLALKLFILATAVSTLLSVHHGLSIKGFVGKVLEGIFLFLAVKEFLSEEKVFYRFLGVWTISAFWIAVSGLWQWAYGVDFIRGNLLSQGRISSTLRHANDLGGYLIALLPLVMIFVFRSGRMFADNCFGFAAPLFKFFGRGKITRLWFIVVFVVMLLSLGLTFSRGAWLGFILAVVILLKYSRRLILPAILGVVSFLIIFQPLMIKARDVSLISDNAHDQNYAFSKVNHGFLSLFKLYSIIEPRDLSELPFHQGDLFRSLVNSGYVDEQGVVQEKFWALKNPNDLILADFDLSFEQKEKFFEIVEQGQYWQTLIRFTIQRIGMGRGEYWQEAFGVIRDYPFWGSGVNTYSVVAPHYRINWGGYPHNSYLQMFAETGMLGLGSFLWVIIVLFRWLFRTLKKAQDEALSRVLLGVTAGFSAYLLHSFFDSTFYSVQLGILLWLQIGLAVAGLGLVQPKPKTKLTKKI